MRTLIAILITASLLAPAAVAYDVFTPVSDYQQISDEPNAPAEGVSFRWAPNNAPAKSYGESRDAFTSALAGTPTVVLDARPTVRFTPTPGQDFTGHWLLKPFIQRDVITPLVNFRALYGEWADSNADTFVQDTEMQGKGVVTPLMTRAAGPDEFDAITGAKIVSYITGYHYRHDDATGGIALHTASDASTPSIEYIEKGDGYYHSLLIVTGFTSATTANPDNELLVTQVMETYEGFLDATSADRDYKRVPGTPVDLDIYQSLDNQVETLYGTSFTSFNDAEHTAQTTAWDPFLQPVWEDANEATQSQDSIVGPPSSQALPVVSNDVNDALGSNPHDYTGNWHPWINLVGRVGAAAPTPALILSGSFFPVSPTADGVEHVAPGVFYPRIFHGVWNDVNADGFITDGKEAVNVGSESASPGCTDLYDCGWNPEPNEYTDEDTPGFGNREFKTICASDGVDFTLTPLTADGSWPGGVYYFGPDGQGARDDETNPIVRDVSDGNVDRLVLSGPIDGTSSCNSSNTPFQYFSDHKYIFPAGNPTFGIRIETEEKCTDLSIVGIPTTECSKDVDVITPWV